MTQDSLITQQLNFQQHPLQMVCKKQYIIILLIIILYYFKYGYFLLFTKIFFLVAFTDYKYLFIQMVYRKQS